MAGGTVTLIPDTGDSVPMILNAEPDRSGGVGGWQATERAQRRPGKWWSSTPDDTMSLDCTLDVDVFPGTSIEDHLRALRDMGQPTGQLDEPPSLKVHGDVWADDRNVTWVITDVKLGARLWNSDGTLRRQQVSVDLERFDAIEEVEAIKVTSTRKKGERRRRTISALQGDTLRTIALRELGNGSRWKDIRTWNKRLAKVDPDQPLRRATHVAIH